MPGERKPTTNEEITQLIGGAAHDHAEDGDWRGPFGYGHRAYRPDPLAHYVFEPGPPRTLPPAGPPLPKPEVLWKRPMR
jgi:hypothetical protein